MKKLDHSVQLRIEKSLSKIAEKPELGKPLGRELAGFLGEHVGGWRIIYDYDEQSVTLHRVRKRDEVYEVA